MSVSVRAAPCATGAPPVPDRTRRKSTPANRLVLIVTLWPGTAAEDITHTSVPLESYMSCQVTPPSSEAWKERPAVVHDAGIWIPQRILAPRLIGAERLCPFEIRTVPV